MKQLFLVFLLYCSLVFHCNTEEVNQSTDYIGDMDSFDGDGGTRVNNGQYQTGHKNNPGTYNTDFDLESQMSISDINAGFDLEYGVTVNSHSSNARLSSCTSITQNSDCRDIFKLTIALFDANEVVHKFEHEVELDFGGNRDYSYSQVIAPNDYQSLTGNFELYGVDAGYSSGWYGPQFSEPYLKTTWEVVEIINEEILNLLEHSDILEVDTNYDTVNVTVENPEGEIMQEFSMDIETDIEIEVAEIETPTIEEPVVEEIEIEVQEVAVEMEEVEVEETVAEEQPTRKQKVVAQAKQKVANKIVKNMGDKGKYDSTNQLKTLVVMQVLGNTTSFFENQKQLQDTPNFFTDAKIPDSSLSDNNYTQYILFGVSNTTHDTLIDSQY
jgi:hypothetical protein